MYIHRGFFAKALLEHPTNPLASPYAHSYLAAYRSALGMLKVIREHYALFPNLLSRFWSLWSHAFSATVSKMLTKSNCMCFLDVCVDILTGYCRIDSDQGERF